MQVEVLPMVPPDPLLSLTCPVSGVSPKRARTNRRLVQCLKKTITETARTRILRGRVGVQHLPESGSYQPVVNRSQSANNHYQQDYQWLIVGGAD